jgi:NADH dehydrogenase FAD-containing subunit
MLVERKTMRQIIKNFARPQMMSDVIWARELDAVAVVGGGRGGVEMGVDGAALRLVVVVVVVVDQHMLIDKDTS